MKSLHHGARLSSCGGRVASHQLLACQKELNHVPSPAGRSCERSTSWQSAVPTFRTCSEEFRGAEQQLWWYVLSSQVFLFMVATGCSCNLLTILESVCCFQLSQSPPLWAVFTGLSEMKPFAIQFLMTIWLCFFPRFIKALRNSPNSLNSSLPLPLSLPYLVWAAVNTQLLDGLAVWVNSPARGEINKL